MPRNYDPILHYFVLILTLTGIVLVFSAYSIPRLVVASVYHPDDWGYVFSAVKPFLNLFIAYLVGFGIYLYLLRGELEKFAFLQRGRFINFAVWTTVLLMVVVVAEKFIFHLHVNRWLIGPKHTLLITGLVVLVYFLFISYQFAKEKINWPKVWVVSIIFWLLLLAQPDTGTFLLLVFSFITLAFFRLDNIFSKVFFYFITLTLAAVSAVAIISAYFGARLSIQIPNFLSGTPFAHAIVRINNWLDPLSDVTDRSYQIANALYAVHKGHLLGEGYGFGMRKLYMGGTVHTDFIFATLGEELGFVFALFIFVLTLLLLLRLLNIAYRFRSNFEKFFTLLVAVETFALAIVNAGMAVNLLPSKGWPYPLISYAPFYMLFYIIQLGIVQYFVRKRFYEVL